MISGFILQLIFELLNFSHLLSFHHRSSLRYLYFSLCDKSIFHIFHFLSPLLDSLELYITRGFENTIWANFGYPFLPESQMLGRVVLYNGQMSVSTSSSSDPQSFQMQVS